jgi:hypothetical protein
MTIDDELAIDILKPFPSYPVLGEQTLSDLSEGIYTTLNWNYGDSSVRVMGTGNVVGSGTKNVLVVGNNRVVEDSNTIYTENLEADKIVLNGVDITTNFRTVDTLQTTNATTTSVSIFDIPDDTMIIIEGRITGYKSDFTEAIAGFYVGTFRKTGGVIVQVGTTSYVTDNDFGVAPVIDLNTDGTNIIFDVKGGAATTINWTNSYEYTIS